MTATISPANTTNQSVTWRSSNTNVATVSADGVVSAIATGTATITVETVDGGLTATCTLNVLAEFVDLGLPSGIKWATCNLGETGFVSSPEQYGSFYSWGETATKGNYSWSNYAFGWKKSLNKYNTDSDYGTVDNLTELVDGDDVAHVLLGGSWRMPTDSEWSELINNSTWLWTTQNGINGVLLTSQYNNKSIFLPAAGCRYDLKLVNVGSAGYYWSSSLFASNPQNAWYGYIASGSTIIQRETGSRNYGQSIRPVKD